MEVKPSKYCPQRKCLHSNISPLYIVPLFQLHNVSAVWFLSNCSISVNLGLVIFKME